jgi:hypothetical protein
LVTARSGTGGAWREQRCELPKQAHRQCRREHRQEGTQERARATARAQRECATATHVAAPCGAYAVAWGAIHSSRSWSGSSLSCPTIQEGASQLGCSARSSGSRLWGPKHWLLTGARKKVHPDFAAGPPWAAVRH